MSIITVQTINKSKKSRNLKITVNFLYESFLTLYDQSLFRLKNISFSHFLFYRIVQRL